jgi:hypothetical protein
LKPLTRACSCGPGLARRGLAASTTISSPLSQGPGASRRSLSAAEDPDAIEMPSPKPIFPEVRGLRSCMCRVVLGKVTFKTRHRSPFSSHGSTASASKPG